MTERLSKQRIGQIRRNLVYHVKEEQYHELWALLYEFDAIIEDNKELRTNNDTLIEFVEMRKQLGEIHVLANEGLQKENDELKAYIRRKGAL